jgi:hypothetical protein
MPKNSLPMQTKKSYTLLVLLAGCCLPAGLMGQGIYNTASIVVGGAPTITIRDGGFHNDGQFNPGTGTVILTGVSAAGISAIGGASSTPFFHLTIAKTTNGASLSGDISVGGNLTMQSGNLDIGMHMIDLGSGAGALVNENNDARILATGSGLITKTADLNAPAEVDPGNIGIVLSSSANLGNTVIRRGSQQQASSGGGLGIARYFDIIPTNNSGLNASLKMYYLDDELAGIRKTELNFYKSENGGSSWSFAGKDNSDETADWVLKNNIDQLSRWTLASNINNPLPLTLLSFTAVLENGQTRLRWVTSQESNSSYFEVQRSVDGASFSGLLTVAAHGNSSTPNTYGAIDPAPLAGNDHYRLKEVDLDGRFVYSPVVEVTVKAGNSLTAWPNPVAGILHVAIQVTQPQADLIGLYDANGKLLLEKEVSLQPGSNLLQLDLGGFGKGVYMLRSKKMFSTPVKIIKL